MLTSGRRILALRLVRRAAEARGMTDLIAHLDAAIAHDRTTRALDSRWRSGARARYSDDMTELDRSADRLLSSLRDIAIAQLDSVDLDDPLYAQAEAMLAAVFPHGVGAVTSLPYPEQAAVMENITAALSGTHAATATALGLARQTTRLVALTAQYRGALEGAVEPLAFAEVHTARRRGQALLLGAMFRVLGAFPDLDDAGHAAARDELLGPIIEQDQAVRAYLRERRRVRDVDPDTGAEDPETSHEDTDPDDPAVGCDGAGDA